MDKGQNGIEIVAASKRVNDDFVLDKDIFSNIFDKDIRRVYIYKKAERLAKALRLVTPAFVASPILKDRVDMIALAIVDAAIQAPASARTALSRELLALSSLLSMARIGSLLSGMNADIIAREAQLLLQEIAVYEEPRLALDDSPTLASIANSARQAQHPTLTKAPQGKEARKQKLPTTNYHLPTGSIGHIKDIKDTVKNGGRREAILTIIRGKGSVYIKDVSTVVRGVSEKTVQRELQALVKEGVLSKTGERRWTLYSLA